MVHASLHDAVDHIKDAANLIKLMENKWIKFSDKHYMM